MKILQITRTDYGDEGEYMCLNTETGSRRSFLAKGKPRFKIVSQLGKMDVKSIHVNQGQDIDIKCYIPNKAEIPDEERYNFTWLREGKPISKTILNDRSNTLTILNIQSVDRGTYTCFVSNGVQNHTESIELRVRDNYAYVWPLICILCEIVILVLVIYIFEDKEPRPEMEESDNDVANGSGANDG
jgi:basigin